MGFGNGRRYNPDWSDSARFCGVETHLLGERPYPLSPATDRDERVADVIDPAALKFPNDYSAHHIHVGRAIISMSYAPALPCVRNEYGKQGANCRRILTGL